MPSNDDSSLTLSGEGISDTRVSLLVRAANLSAEAIATRVGLQPDSIHDRTAEDRGTLTVVTYMSQCEGDAETQLSQLLLRLRPFQTRICALSTSTDIHSVTVTVAEFFNTDNPTFLFAADQLAAIAALGAGLWLDLYLVDEPQ